MLDESQRIPAFEAALRHGFGLDPAALLESEGWWRFEIEGIKFQGGIHSRDVQVSALICNLDPGCDFDAFYGDMNQAACPEGLARFAEADCYLYAKAALPFGSVSQAQIEQAIRDCITVTRSPGATGLRANWAWYG